MKLTRSAQHVGKDPAGSDDDVRPGHGYRVPRGRWRTVTAIYTVVVLGVLIGLNVLGTRVHARYDLTANRRYTLSRSTLQVLRGLKSPLQIYGFLQPGSRTAGALQDLLQEYRYASPGKVTVQIIDPSSRPALAREYGVTEPNEVVVAAGTARATVTSADVLSYAPDGSPLFDGENAVTNAILRAAHPERVLVYFLQGHGEHASQGDYATISQGLSSQGYTVKDLNLVSRPSVPADAAAVIIAGPTRDLAPVEAQALQEYARAGGHLLVLLDASTGQPLARLEGLLAALGVRVQHDVVVDPVRNFRLDPLTPIPLYQNQTITAPLQQNNLLVIMPYSVGLTPLRGQPYRAAPLLTTSPQAWGKTNLKNASQTYNPKEDLMGPLDLGVTVTSTVKGDTLRAVVLGSSTFASDSYLVIQGNRDLFLNSVGWLTGRAEGIRIRPAATLNDQVFLTASSVRGLFLGYVLLLPVLALVGAGVVRSWRRRL